MFEKVPTQLKLAALIGVMLAGPVVLFSFYFGGVSVGIGAIAGLFILSIVLYIVTVRKYT